MLYCALCNSSVNAAECMWSALCNLWCVLSSSLWCELSSQSCNHYSAVFCVVSLFCSVLLLPLLWPPLCNVCCLCTVRSAWCCVHCLCIRGSQRLWSLWMGGGGGRGQFLKYRPICNAFNPEPAAGGNLPPCQATLLLCWSQPQDAIAGVVYHLFVYHLVVCVSSGCVSSVPSQFHFLFKIVVNI